MSRPGGRPRRRSPRAAGRPATPGSTRAPRETVPHRISPSPESDREGSGSGRSERANRVAVRGCPPAPRWSPACGPRPGPSPGSRPREIRPVENLEHEPEAVFQLALPLLQHRGRRRNHDGVRLPAQEQLAGNETCLDGLAEPGVVGDEEVDARQPKGLAQRLHLVRVDADAGPERRLEETRVGRGDAVPSQRVQEGGKLPRRVESLGREVGPALVLENVPVELVVPEDGERLSLRIVVGAGEPDDRGLAGCPRLDDLLDQPPSGANLDQFAGGGCPFRKLLRQCGVHAPVIITPRSRTSPPGRGASRRGTRASSRCARCRRPG